MKLQYLTLVSLLLSGHVMAVEECKNLPKNAVTKIKEPLNKWVSIQCLNKKGMVAIVPAAGMKWMSRVKKSVMLVAGDLAISANMSDQDNSAAPKKWISYFVKQGSIKAKGMGVVSANMMLHKETKSPAKFGKIYKLSLLANNKRVKHLIFYASHDLPVWLIACNDQCKTREVYRVER